MMDVPDDLVFNFFVDMKKKDINPVERAELIKAYCKKHKLSLRGLARELGMSHSTIQDWADYSRITKQEYVAILEKGAGKKAVHKMLRKTRGGKNIKGIISYDLNIKLEQATVMLNPYVYNPKSNNETLILLNKLRNTLNRIELHIERDNR